MPTVSLSKSEGSSAKKLTNTHPHTHTLIIDADPLLSVRMEFHGIPTFASTSSQNYIPETSIFPSFFLRTAASDPAGHPAPRCAYPEYLVHFGSWPLRAGNTTVLTVLLGDARKCSIKIMGAQMLNLVEFFPKRICSGAETSIPPRTRGSSMSRSLNVPVSAFC